MENEGKVYIFFLIITPLRKLKKHDGIGNIVTLSN